jgi:hypothetical protein
MSCPFCGVALTGPIAEELREESSIAAEALDRRQSLIDRLPVAASQPPPPGMAASPVAVTDAALPAYGARVPGAPTPVAAPAARPTSQVSLQSILAIAGAGLFAVAAIVFNFLNRDLMDPGLRVGIIGVITAIFLGGAWLLSRRRLQFSAEAIGALGMVFVALDISSFAELAPDDVSLWTFAGIGTAVSAAVLVLIAALVRIRTWLWAGMLGLVLAPAFFGYGGDGRWAALVGHLVAGAVTVVAHVGLRRLSARFSSAFRTDHATAATLRLLVVVIVLVQLVVIDVPTSTERVLGTAAALLTLALLAGFSARYVLGGLWSLFATLFGVAAVALLPLALDLPTADAPWYLALVPAAATIGVGILALIPALPSVRAGAWTTGAFVVTLAAALPAVAVTVVQVLSIWVRFGLERETDLGPLHDVWRAPDEYSVVPPEVGLAAWLGIGVAVAGLGVLSASSRRAPDAPGRYGRAVLAVACWCGMLGLLGLATWSQFSWAVQLIVALAAAGVVLAALLALPGLRRAPATYRVPLVAGAHALIVVAVVTSWTANALTVLGGVAIVAAIVVLAHALPRPVRAVHIGVAYGYGLLVFARALDLAGVETIAVLALTTSLAAICALVATLVHRLPVPYWYAILIVTFVPFVIGVVTVIRDRSGWTAISTALIFALALTLLATRRSGLNRLVRSSAAALLVPSLAVVVVCLASQFLEISGSRVALPVIATIVALTLAAGRVITDVLRRGGQSDEDVRIARGTIEVSSLVTAGIAVALALFLPAAGYEIAMIVLLILGIGSAAARIFAGRPYGWWGAGASWTGALWCVWALAGVDVVEPYILPPALGAVAIGTILIARGREGVALVATGLVTAVAPTLVLLAVAGNGVGAEAPWRTVGTLAAAAVLLLVGLVVTRRPGARLAALRIPVLAVAIGAAAGGAIQAVRLGLGQDPIGRDDDPQQLMFVVLGYSALATALAVAAAALLRRTAVAREGVTPRLARTRWLLAPALVYLVAGPISAVGPGAVPTWTLWTLMLVVLAVLVVTAWRSRVASTALPPAWFTFLAAWCTAVAGWSERLLHVEWFSLPLGVALLAAGVIAFTAPAADAAERRDVNAWPAGPRRSWWQFAPGIVVTILPSVLATMTNPATWRAILVIVLALASILVGSRWRLAAPFVLSLVVLPLEIVIVFVVQIIGGEISPTSWWITLATAGALLLVLAVGSERRTAAGGGLAARMRDLR